MFDFGILGIYHERANKSYMQCGCEWAGIDHHLATSRCEHSPHPAARIIQGPYFQLPNSDYGVRFLMDRGQGEWIQKLIRIQPMIRLLQDKLKNSVVRLTPFLRDAICLWLIKEFDCRRDDASQAIQIFLENRTKKVTM